MRGNLSMLAAMPAWASVTLSIVAAVAVLLVMITVHELGHYIAGKILKFKVDEFAIGFGPKLFSHTWKNGEVFSLRLLPLGGFCAFHGEEDETKADAQSFFAQKPWKRLIVQFAGAFTNFLFSILIVIVSFCGFGQFLTSVAEVLPDDPASQNYVETPAKNMLRKGDIIVALNGKDIYITSDLTNAGKDMAVNRFIEAEIIRDGVRMTVPVKWRDYVRLDKETGEVAQRGTGLGILIGSSSYRFPFFEGVGRSFVYSGKMFVETLLIPAKLISGQVGVDSVGGPITTIGMTAQFARMGFHYLLEIVSMIGISLAVFNLFPIPGLDGAHMVFTTIEWIRKKPVNRKVENAIHLIGMLLLFGLVITVDLLHMFL